MNDENRTDKKADVAVLVENFEPDPVAAEGKGIDPQFQRPPDLLSIPGDLGKMRTDERAFQEFQKEIRAARGKAQAVKVSE